MRRNNNFDLLRLFAGVLVIISHSFGVLNKGGLQPSFRIANRQIIASSLGVFIFFVISGYLVVQSLERSSGIRQYIKKRALRIYPAIIVCNILCIVLLGLFFSALPFFQYLKQPDTWSYLWYNTTLYKNQFYLPGVFTSLAPANEINASIWTLTPELLLYILLLLLFLFKFLRPAFTFMVFFILFIIFCYWCDDKSINGWPLDYYINFSLFFFAGAALHLLRKYILFRWYWAAFFAAVVYMLPGSWLQWLFFIFMVSYMVIYAGNKKQLFNLKGLDISYGLYIYAFPIQQIILIAAGNTLAPWLHVSYSVLCTLPFAFASWKWVEAPALRLKGK